MAPRPCNKRRIRGTSDSSYFKPAGMRARELEQVTLSLAEFEALRLKDVVELDQQTSAEHMQISQPTFHRLLLTARKKVSDALVHGKAIRIETSTQEEQ